MASRTQLRLSQVTGSFNVLGDGRSIITTEPASAVAAINVADLSGSLSHIASAVGRIHGRSAGEAFNNAEGTFYVDILPSADGSLDLGSSNFEFAEAHVNALKSATTLDVDATGALTLDSAASISIGTNADKPIDIDSTTLDIDASGAITIDSTSTIVISGDGGATLSDDTEGLAYDGSGNVDFDAVALDIDASGALTLDSATSISIGTNADKPIDIDSTTLDIDASGAITIDTTSTFSIDGVGGCNVTTDTGNLLLQTTSGGQVDIDAAGSVDIDAGSSITLDSGTTGNITLTAGDKVVLTGSSGADSVHIQSELTVVGDAIFTGNLTVNGDQFKVDGNTVVVDDSLLELATVDKAAPGSSTTSKDKGLLLHHHNGTAASLNFMGFDSTNAAGKFTFKTGVTDDGDGSISGGSVATILADIEGSSTLSVVSDSTANTAFPVVFHDEANALLDDTGSFLYNPNTGLMTVSKVDADGGITIDNITIDGTEIDLSSGDLTVDVAGDIILNADGADIFFEDDTARFGGISMNAGANYLILSSSAGNGVALSSQSGKVFLGDKNFSGLTVAADIANQLQFLDRDDRLRINLESNAGNDRILLSGSVRLDNGADISKVIFEEDSDLGNNTVTIQSPASALAGSYQLALPQDKGTAGQVLKINSVNGSIANLAFGDADADLAKGVKFINSTLAAGQPLAFNSVDAGEAISGLSDASSQGKSLDVFVNGQLLISGSESERAAGSRDYAIASGTELKFAFSLETDDVVQLIKR